YQLRFGWTSLNYWQPPWIRLLGLVQCQPLLGLDFLDWITPSWIGLLELDCKLQSGFSLDILSLVLDFLVRHFDLGLGFSFLFCRALTLNLDFLILAESSIALTSSILV
ncbi:hypothetical protein RhiirA4_487453, partial [Rhizophagus irregularis]